MGGNALKHVGVTRKTTAEYVEIASKVIAALDAIGVVAELLPSYREKETHGDIDIIYIPTGLYDKDKFKKLFNPQDILENGDAISLDYMGIQVDFISVTSEYFEVTRDYYSYNDICNLIGRVAHRMGLIFGHKGLLTSVTIQNNHVGYITLSTEPRKIFEFLGYDYDRFRAGFDNLNQMFEYVVSSRFFCASDYSDENNNHANRARNKKRPTYQKFQEYLAANKIDHGLSEDVAPNPLVHFKCVHKYHYVLYEAYRKAELKERFNGDLVSRLTGFKGEDLGKFIAKLKKSRGGDAEFYALLENLTDAQVESMVLDFHGLQLE